MNSKVKKYLDEKITLDLKGKNVFITGGNSGIGFETAKECAYLGANIFILCRSLERGNAAKSELLRLFSTAKVELIKLDLASFHSIKQCVEEVKKYDVDIFINNAGVYHLPKSETEDKFEITMGTNFIGVTYLNDLLNEYFITLKHPIHVIFTTSLTSKYTKVDCNDFYSEHDYKRTKVYAKSKAGINDLFFTYCEQFLGQNIFFSLVHPGATYTPLITKGYKNKVFRGAAEIFMKTVFHTPEKAALTNIFALNLGKTSMIGPRGFIEISGWPHLSKFKKDKNYKEVVEFARQEIEKAVNN